MQASKWGNSLAVRLPKEALVEDLGLKPGDVLEVVSATPERIAIAKDDFRALAVERMCVRGPYPKITYSTARKPTPGDRVP